MRISVQGCLFAALLAALVAMLGLPALGHPARRAAAAAPIGQADTGGRGAPDDVATLLQRVGITPSTIATAVPGATPPPAGPVDNGGLIGPAGVTGELGIPAMVLQAYRQAAAELAKEQPGCHLPWWLLAGIGHTESGHAEDGRLYADGTTRGRILGPRLNGGIAGDAIITDTDHGVYDGDTQYDRAVGPMQFIPSTWRVWGADGNHDGKRDPNNIFDATLAAGHYLCADGRNLATMAGLTAAVLSYNHSQAYLNTVLAWGLAYRSGASSVPDQTIPVVGDVTKVRPPLSARPPVAPRPLPRTAGGTPTRAAPSGPAGPTSSTPGSSPATPSCPGSSAPPATASSSAAAAGSSSAPPASSSAAAAGTASGSPSANASGSAALSLAASGSAASSLAASADGSADSSPTSTGSPTPSC